MIVHRNLGARVFHYFSISSSNCIYFFTIFSNTARPGSHVIVCRSCPPGPWLPAASASGASGSRECHQLTSAGGQSSCDQTMSSSFSATQRLNNQLSVDSGGSLHPRGEPRTGAPDSVHMSRHPPLYSEAPHFPLHNNHSWNWSPPDANVTSETRDESRDDTQETRAQTRDQTCDILVLQQQVSEYNQSLPTKPYRTFYKSTPVWNWYSGNKQWWKQNEKCPRPKYILLHECSASRILPSLYFPDVYFFPPRLNVCLGRLLGKKCFCSSWLIMISIFRPDFSRKGGRFCFLFFLRGKIDGSETTTINSCVYSHDW